MTKIIDELDEVIFTPSVPKDDELVITDSQAAEEDVKAVLNALDTFDEEIVQIKKAVTLLSDDAIAEANFGQGKKISNAKSDGSTASYYELPEDAKELQDLISFKNMNAQMGEIGRAWYRYGQVAHSEKLRDAKKIKYYIEAEIERLEKYGDQ